MTFGKEPRILKIDPSLRKLCCCAECGKLMIATPSGFVSCPDAHGKLIAPKDFAFRLTEAAKDIARETFDAVLKGGAE